MALVKVSLLDALQGDISRFQLRFVEEDHGSKRDFIHDLFPKFLKNQEHFSCKRSRDSIGVMILP